MTKAFKNWLFTQFDYDENTKYYYAKNAIGRPCYDSRCKSDMGRLMRQFNALKNRNKVCG